MPRIKSSEIEYKEKKVKGLLDTVTATLSGSQSAVFTKLGRRYKKIDNLIKKLQEAREKMNEDVKVKVEALFEVEDALLTRVVDTVSITANLSKRTPAGTKEVTKFDAEGMIEEMYETMPELHDKLDELMKRYKKVTEVPVPERSPALRVKFKESEDSNDVLGMIEEYAELSAKRIMNGLKGFDTKIADIKSRM